MMKINNATEYGEFGNGSKSSWKKLVKRALDQDVSKEQILDLLRNK